MTFHDTMPMAPAGAAPAAAPRGPTGAPHDAARAPRTEAAARALRIEFTGSGSEYFRIWIVNLLLTLVTLGLYYPFAKARRLRYFHANTLVDGHALGFHGDAWKMLRGYLLVLTFAVLYGAAGHFSPTAGVLAALAFAVLWPALWQSSLRFRLANTSWRGLRLRFGGSLRDAYLALAPALLPPLAIVLLALPRDADAATPANVARTWAGFGAILAMVALTPLLMARIKRYQHGHYQFADQTTRLDAPTRRFYGLWLRTFLLSLLPGVVLGVVVAASSGSLKPGAPTPGMIVLFGVLLLCFYLALFLLTQPYFVARLQDLVWGGTASAQLRFGSRLKARALAALTLKNLVLMALTLGLYRPFAVIATTRLRLQAISLQLSGDVDAWVATAAHPTADASGDAAGELLGIDFGL